MKNKIKIATIAVLMLVGMVVYKQVADARENGASKPKQKKPKQKKNDEDLN